MSTEAASSDPNAIPFDGKRLLWIIIAAVVFLFFQFVCPVPAGLQRTAMSAVGILFCCIILWVSDAVPFIITVVLIFLLLPITGILPYSTTPSSIVVGPDSITASGKAIVDGGAAVTANMGPYAVKGATTTYFGSVFNSSSLLVPLYCLFVFTVSGSVMSTPLPYRVAKKALQFAGNNPRKLLMTVMFVTSVLSMFISDLASSAIFIGIGIAICEANGGVKGESELGKAFTLGIGAAAAIGGIGTPIGNSLNILCATLVEQMMGIRTTFLAWCVMNIPLAIVTSLLAGFYLSHVFKLEEIKPEALQKVEADLGDFGKMTTREKKVLAWFIIAFVLMIFSTWFPQINSMEIAFAFTILAFVPGIQIITKKIFYDAIPWEVIMMIIGVQALATGIVGTGVAKWFVSTALAGAAGWPPLLTIFVMAAITMILHILIPVGPPCITVAIPLMVAIAQQVNGQLGYNAIDGGVIAVIGGTLGAVTTWLPIDTIMMISYEKGWASMKTWVSKNWVCTVILLILATLWLPVISPLMTFSVA